MDHSTDEPMTASVRADSWCSTDLKVVNFSYKWTIINFANHGLDDIKFESSLFSSGPKDSMKWYLRITTTSESSSRSSSNRYYPQPVVSGHILLDLFLHSKQVSSKYAKTCSVQAISSPEEPVRGKFKVSLLNRQGKVIHSKEYHKIRSFTVQPLPTPTASAQLVLPSSKPREDVFIDRATLFNKPADFLQDGNLIVFCEVTVLDQHKVHAPGTKHGRGVPDSKLSQHFGALYTQTMFTDVTLVVGSEEYKAHKGVLAVRSPVFKAMFEHRMSETISSRVEITDFDPKVIQEMLHYIYTDQAPNLESMAQNLFVAAEKYQLERLMKMCEVVLASKVTTENVIDTLAFADLHSLAELKENCLHFIAVHSSKVMKTQSWQTLKTENIAVFAEVVERTLALKS